MPGTWTAQPVALEALSNMRHHDLAARTALRTTLMAVTLLCCADAVIAQTPRPDANVENARDPCQARPQGEPRTDKQQGTRNGEAENKAAPDLERCKGVLTPPKTGDKEIEKPAPEPGTTPVIPPEDVPQQAPK